MAYEKEAVKATLKASADLVHEQISGIAETVISHIPVMMKAMEAGLDEQREKIREIEAQRQKTFMAQSEMIKEDTIYE